MKGQQGWCGVAEEEEGRGSALTSHRRPNPTADCSHTVSRQGQTHRAAEEGAKNKKEEDQQMRGRRKEKRKTMAERGGKGQTLLEEQQVDLSCVATEADEQLGMKARSSRAAANHGRADPYQQRPNTPASKSLLIMFYSTAVVKGSKYCS